MSIVGKRQSPNYFTALGYELFWWTANWLARLLPASGIKLYFLKRQPGTAYSIMWH